RLHATSTVVPGCAFRFAEVPERAERIHAALQTNYPESIIAPTDHGLAPLLAVHTADYLNYLENAYRLRQQLHRDGLPAIVEAFPLRAGRQVPTTYPGISGWYAFDTYAPILEGTWLAAYEAAQCAVTAADFVRGGEKTAYALCRPPGHHAGVDTSGGYC